MDCPDCGTAYKLPPAAAGKRARCKMCGAEMSVPAASTPVAAATKTPSRTQRMPAKLPGARPLAGISDPDVAPPPKTILKMLEGEQELPRPTVTIGHRLTALFVACVMILLPLLYIAFIVAVAWLTWMHITVNVWMLRIRGIRAAIIMFVLYTGLAAMGCVWLLSLLKPLFMRFAAAPRTEGGLTREDEPLLFAFADRLADKVGAPRPDNIQLTLDSDASASYETTFFGLQRKSFTLTLGLPLIGGLKLSQLAGIMAREFGHFSQAGSSLLDRLISRVNLWFETAIHRRDWIDDEIEYCSNKGDDALLVLLGGIMYVIVACGKGVLWCLMQIGRAVSATLLRSMELNADRYQIGVVGSAVFAQTARRMVELEVAHSAAKVQVFDSTHGEYLPDDFPAFVVGLANYSKRVRKKAAKRVENEKLSLLSTRPTTRSRIHVAEKLNDPGIFKSDAPAHSIMKTFTQRSKDLSDAKYSARWGHRYAPGTRRSAKDAVDAYIERTDARKE